MPMLNVCRQQYHMKLINCVMCRLNVNVLQVERMVQEAERNAEEDRRRREVIDLKNQVHLSKPTSQLLLKLTSKMGVKK